MVALITKPDRPTANENQWSLLGRLILKAEPLAFKNSANDAQ
jgi:hypothetical protein